MPEAVLATELANERDPGRKLIVHIFFHFVMKMDVKKLCRI